jgi:WhiB family redox-sensing transcriptional regulator
MAWQQDAACAGVGSDVFLPDRHDVDLVKEAQRLCAMCPVQRECLEWAQNRPEYFGTWGGMSEHKRKKMRTERNREAVA